MHRSHQNTREFMTRVDAPRLDLATLDYYTLLPWPSPTTPSAHTTPTRLLRHPRRCLRRRPRASTGQTRTRTRSRGRTPRLGTPRRVLRLRLPRPKKRHASSATRYVPLDILLRSALTVVRHRLRAIPPFSRLKPRLRTTMRVRTRPCRSTLR